MYIMYNVIESLLGMFDRGMCVVYNRILFLD